MEDADLDARLCAYLEDSARQGLSPSYGEAARALQVPGPKSVHRLTEAAERLMAEDAARGRAFRAAALSARLTPGRPARGFFEAARRLGRYDGPETGPEADAFHEAELTRLRAELS